MAGLAPVPESSKGRAGPVAPFLLRTPDMSVHSSRMMTRGRILALLVPLLGPLLVGGAAAEGPAVTWTDIVNASVSGEVLQKTAIEDWDPSGAVSAQALTAGDGYVEFTVGEADTLWMGGLGHGNDDTGYTDIDFGFRFNGAGSADVLENGTYQNGGDTTYDAGDVFRVAVVGGRVQYSQNGRLILESAQVPQYPLLLDVSLNTVGATVHNAVLVVSPPPPPGGGFTEISGSPARRERFTPSQIAAFLPPDGGKGTFTFPAPYNTEGVRLTDSTDCADGQDCLWYAGYSYWRNINNHVGSTDMYVFIGTEPSRGGVGPVLIRYDKITEEVQNLGPLFEAGSPYSASTGEGWYFSGTHPTRLYTSVVGSRQLRRYDVLLRRFERLPALDLDTCARPRNCPAAAAYITQAHSSDDDLVHSATVQDAEWRRIGCVVYQAPRRFRYYAPPAGYALDECHVDKSGRWLILLETRGDGSRRNRVVDLRSGKITAIEGAEGGLGHLDTGFGYAVGADTFSSLENATILLKFPIASTTRPVGPVVHFNKRWDIAAANHIAHGNARAGVAPESQYACGSNAGRVPDMADEIVCFPLDASRNADGSLTVLVVGQIMTDLDAAGGRDDDGDDYEQTPKGNLDVTGRYFFWTANLGGDRLDAFLVKVPAERLVDVTAVSGRRSRVRAW